MLYEELRLRVAEDKLGIFIGMEDSYLPSALAVAMLPSSSMMMAPQIVLVYSEGPPALIKKVAHRLRKWITDAGYDRAIGINLWREDLVFMRGFKHFGTPARLGSLIEFRFGEST